MPKNKQQEELDALDASHSEEEPVEQEQPEPVVEEQPEPVEAPDVEPEAAPVTEEAAPAEPEPEAPSEVEQLRAQMSEMQKFINRLAAGEPIIDIPEKEIPAGVDRQAAAGQPAKAEEKPPEPPKPLIDEQTYEAIMSDSGKFNDFLQGVIQEAQKSAVQQAYGLAMQHLPQTIMPTIQEAARQQYEVTSWANSNPIVTQNRELAGLILNQVDGHYPHLSTQEKLDMALGALQQRVGFPQQAAPAAPTQPAQAPGTQQPAFAQPPRGGKPSAPQLSGLQKELDDLVL